METHAEHGIAAPGHRLPREAHPGAVRLQIADLDRSIAYYERTIGCRVLHRSATTATLGPQQGDETELIELHEKTGVRSVPAKGRLGLYHFAILLPDRVSLGHFIRHLEASGVARGSADHLVSEALYLRDPDGLGIEVYADRSPDTWQWRGRELVMVADPLDTANIVNAAGEGEWTGLPPRTVMGHVHLHVGDLDEASRFYHAGLGFDKTSWSFPGALFLSAGGYHHHLGLNTWAPTERARDDEAKLLEWELILPGQQEVTQAGHAMEAAGYDVARSDGNWTIQDPWGTTLRVGTETQSQSQ